MAAEPVPHTPRHVTPTDAGYPDRLRALKPAVRRLWYRGRLPAGPAVAIVGSRAATRVGCDLARHLAAALARRGHAVLSGGAFGIDAAAHEGALDAGGDTFGVLGCGVDVVYPDRHARLFDRIVLQGGLLSELAPGEPPRARQFPSRNRIVAALADAVIVVQAAARSGALITAARAAELGRRLLAVPGTPGTDALLGSGALPVTSPDDLWEALAGRTSTVALPPLPPRQAELIAALTDGPENPGSLARRLGLSLPALMGLLTEAELAGRIRRLGGSQYEVLRGH